VDIDDVIIISLTLWVILCSLFIHSVEIYVTLLLIGLLVITVICDDFINPKSKQNLKILIYILLFIFMIIVVKKIINILR